MTEQNKGSLSVSKRVFVFSILGLILILAGSVFGIDWMNYFLGTKILYPAIGKPVITLFAMVIVLITGRDRINNKDFRLLLAAFCCMLPTDILMSVVVVSPSLSVGSWVFMLGGGLSILAHIFLIIRISQGLPYLKKGAGGVSRFWLPLAIYGSAVVVIFTLWTDIVRVGHAAIAPIYTAFFCTTMWFAWETLRNKLYPKINAWMVSIAATCWYLTEIFGEIYNLGLGNISEIMFRLVWVFYGTNVVLWALSGYKWKEK
jgi:hypothetical protein